MTAGVVVWRTLVADRSEVSRIACEIDDTMIDVDDDHDRRRPCDRGMSITTDRPERFILAHRSFSW